MTGVHEYTAGRARPGLARSTVSVRATPVFGGQVGGALAWVSANGGAVHRLTTVATANGEQGHFAPLVSQDGRTVFFSMQDIGDGEIGVVELDAEASVPAPHVWLTVTGRVIATWRDWLLLRGLEGVLTAVMFDARSRSVGRERITVLEEREAQMQPIALARDGTLLSTRRVWSDSVVQMDDRGNGVSLFDYSAERSQSGNRGFMMPRISPDDQRLGLMASLAQGIDVWSFDRPTHGLREQSGQFQRRRLFAVDTGCGRQRPAAQAVPESGRLWGTLTPHEGTLVFQALAGDKWALWTRSVNGADSVAGPLFVEAAGAYMPQISPDRRWLAYASSSDAGDEVYVRPFLGPGAPLRVSERGGVEPMWGARWTASGLPVGPRLHRGRDHVGADLLGAVPVSALPRLVRQGECRTRIMRSVRMARM